jgi:serine/threonine protein kinase
MYVPDMILPFGIGVFCTSLGDGFAGLMGQLMNTPSNCKIYGNKTIYGTMFNWIVCTIVVGVINSQFGLGMLSWQVFAIAVFATLLELFTVRGLDNVTVTLGTSFLSYFFIHFDGAENYIIPILLTPIMIAFAYKKRALTTGGIITAIIVDVIISVSLGNFGFIILLAFFIGGLVTDKIKQQHISKVRNRKHHKSSPRTYQQVLANGITATVCAVLFSITQNQLFVVCFVAALSEALADTASSGVGALSKNTYDILQKMISESIVDPRKRNPFVSAVTAKIVMKMLHKNPAKRYQTPQALLDALNEVLQRCPASAVPGIIRSAVMGTELPQGVKKTVSSGILARIHFAFFSCRQNIAEFFTPSTGNKTKQESESSLSCKYFSFQIESDLPSDKALNFMISASPSATYKISSIDGYYKEIKALDDGTLKINDLPPGEYKILSLNRKNP